MNERLGDAAEVCAVLYSTLPGMPLIYSGQEEPLKKRLEFFVKDPIGFSNYAYSDFFYAILLLQQGKNRG